MISCQNPRQLAFNAIKDVYRKGVYTDIALEKVLRPADVNQLDRGLVCELVYGIVRRQRSLDFIIDLLGKKKAAQQPPDLRIILQIGLYQLRYLQQIPASAAVNTTVELAKENGLPGLSGVVNALLRKSTSIEPLTFSAEEPVTSLGVTYSFPDWIIEMWLQELGSNATQELCNWFNQPPSIDLRINPLKTSIDQVKEALEGHGVSVCQLPHLPQGLRLKTSAGSIENLPGFKDGWWVVQDSSAQLVTHLLDPQPGEIVIDACAAPGGKTTHIAELMEDQGKIWAGDIDEKRLRKVKQNAERLQLNSISVIAGDSRFAEFTEKADRVLIDAPCSGLGTLHKRPDIRWRQTPEKIKKLSLLQGEILKQGANWVKPGGILVYATCTLNPLENEAVVQAFLDSHPNWQIQLPSFPCPAAAFPNTEGLIKIWPFENQMDGFFMVKLKKGL